MNKALGGPGACSPEKCLKIHILVTVFFEQVLGKFYFIFLPLNLSVSPNMRA